jgi:ubiquinone/menaquinone biosynthesis C-methylase UbiE
MWRPNYAGASLRNHLIFDPLYVLTILFGIIGMWMLRKQWRQYSLLYLYILFHIAIHSLLYGIIRYRLPVEPILLLFAAEGFFRIRDRVGIMRPGVLESLFQRWRMRKILPFIPRNAVVMDLGCGEGAVFLRTVARSVRRGIGFDSSPLRQRLPANMQYYQKHLTKRIPLTTASVTHIVSLAVFGNFDYPIPLLRECRRILKPNGLLVFTIPLPPNKWLMGILGKIGLLDPKLVNPYKYFYSTTQLRQMFTATGFTEIKIKKFQLGFNCCLMARRTI